MQQLSSRCLGRGSAVVGTLNSSPVLVVHLLHLPLDEDRFVLRPFDCCCSVPLSLPSLNVTGHLGYATDLFVNVVAELALVLMVIDLVDELEATCLAGPGLLDALLTKGTPSPVSALPSYLIKVAHFVDRRVPFSFLSHSRLPLPELDSLDHSLLLL